MRRLPKPYAWWVIVVPEASEAPETLRLLVAFAPRASEAPETLRLVGQSRARSSGGRDILRNLRWLVKLASETGGLSKPYAWWVIVAPEAYEAPETNTTPASGVCAPGFRGPRNTTPGGSVSRPKLQRPRHSAPLAPAVEICIRK